MYTVDLTFHLTERGKSACSHLGKFYNSEKKNNLCCKPTNMEELKGLKTNSEFLCSEYMD